MYTTALQITLTVADMKQLMEVCPQRFWCNALQELIGIAAMIQKFGTLTTINSVTIKNVAENFESCQIEVGSPEEVGYQFFSAVGKVLLWDGEDRGWLPYNENIRERHITVESHFGNSHGEYMLINGEKVCKVDLYNNSPYMTNHGPGWVFRRWLLDKLAEQYGDEFVMIDGSFTVESEQPLS